MRSLQTWVRVPQEEAQLGVPVWQRAGGGGQLAEHAEEVRAVGDSSMFFCALTLSTEPINVLFSDITVGPLKGVE